MPEKGLPPHLGVADPIRLSAALFQPVVAGKCLKSMRTRTAASAGACAVAAVSAVLAAACGTGPLTGPPGSPARPGHQTGVLVKQAGSGAATTAAPCRRSAPVIGPLSASFVTASEGWLLGITVLPCQGPLTGSRIALRKTADGGRHWTPLPAPATGWGMPDASGTAGVSQILFANPRDGWAYGPGLWATRDGGARWHQVATHGDQVYSMAAADGRVIAAFTAAGQPRGRFVIYTSPVAYDDWQPIAGAAGYGSAQVVIGASSGYATSRSPGTPSGGTLLGGPADGTARWQPRPLPCAAWPVAAASGAGLAIACSLIGAHPTPTREYLSTDGGWTWRRLAGLLLFDGAATISTPPGGPIIIGGAYSGVLISWDGGHTWHGAPVVDRSAIVEGGGGVTATMTDSRDGYAIAVMSQIWVTHDAGHTWTPVAIH